MTDQVMPSSSKNIERYTPAWIGEGLSAGFDLDPAAPAGDYPMATYCSKRYTLEDDGLTQSWEGLVWLNPPRTRGAKSKWIAKLASHGNGIALVRGGVDSKWLHDNAPDSLFLLRDRVQYVRADGQGERERKGQAVGGFEPSMLLAYGSRAGGILRHAKLEGMYLERRAA